MPGFGGGTPPWGFWSVFWGFGVFFVFVRNLHKCTAAYRRVPPIYQYYIDRRYAVQTLLYNLNLKWSEKCTLKGILLFLNQLLNGFVLLIILKSLLLLTTFSPGILSVELLMLMGNSRLLLRVLFTYSST